MYMFLSLFISLSFSLSSLSLSTPLSLSLYIYIYNTVINLLLNSYTHFPVLKSLGEHNVNDINKLLKNVYTSEKSHFFLPSFSPFLKVICFNEWKEVIFKTKTFSKK